MSKSARRQRKQAQLKKEKARPSATAQKVDQEQPSQDRTPERAWLNWPTSLVLTSLLSVAIAVYIGWQVASQQGLGRGVVWGAMAGASIWIAFYASYRFNRWLRQR